MNQQEATQKLPAHDEASRDWEESEWFREWLALNRDKRAMDAAN